MILSICGTILINFFSIFLPIQVQLGESKACRRQELPVVGAANT